MRASKPCKFSDPSVTGNDNSTRGNIDRNPVTPRLSADNTGFLRSIDPQRMSRILIDHLLVLFNKVLKGEAAPSWSCRSLNIQRIGSGHASPDHFKPKNGTALLNVKCPSNLGGGRFGLRLSHHPEARSSSRSKGGILGDRLCLRCL